MKQTIFTIGHSTRSIEEFIELLKEYKIEQVIDVRTIPKSRHNPQFNMEELSRKLESENIKYFHINELGGLRHSKKDSINLAWKNLSFRGFADYMQTDEFKIGLNELIKLSRNKISAIMCAESVPWRCHRSLISDALLIKGIDVIHILSRHNVIEHKMTPFAKIVENNIFYP
ncbi:MAG: DUF488 family protein [Nanoarchaeota archaeon]